MSKQGRLLKNILILFIGVIGTRLINFIMLPLYTGWLSVEEYGEIDVFTTIVGMCVPILTLQLDQAVFRFMIDDETLPRRRGTVSSALGCLLLCLLAVDIPLGVLFALQGQRLYLLYLLAINLQCLYTMFQQIARGQGKNSVYSINSMLLAFVTVGFTVLFIRVLPWSVEGYVLAFCLAHGVCLVYLFLRTGMASLIRRADFALARLKALLRYSVPMIVNNVSWWILNASDKLVLNIFIGAAANGIFAAAGKISGLLTTVYTVFQMAWQESTSREKDDHPEVFYSQIFRKLFAFLCYMLACLLLMGRVVFTLLIDDKFAEAYVHVPILLVGLLFFCVAQFYGGIYVGRKMSRELGLTSAAAACVNLAVDLGSIRFIGIFAASISTFTAYAVLCVIRMFSVRRFCRLHYRAGEILVCAVVVAVCFAAAYMPFGWLQVGLLLFVTALFALLFRDVLGEMLQAVKKRLIKK